MGLSMVAWSHLGLGLGIGQLYEGLPKGSRLSLDRDAWLRWILAEVIINEVYRLSQVRRFIRLVNTGKMVEVLADEPRSMLNGYSQPI